MEPAFVVYATVSRHEWFAALASDSFIDVPANHLFADFISKLARAGITRGCNPADGNTRFCPNDCVTRGQMAAFLVRALKLPAYPGPNRFTDDNGNIFEDAIERLAQAGITRGCNPDQGNTRFCLNQRVTRGLMAAFRLPCDCGENRPQRDRSD